jgi:serine phosphatase RsbU (regulator of sigma subunit)
MKILLIEDRAAEQLRSETELRGLGHAVIVSCSAEEGIELYRSERPDAVIAGIHPDGIDGFALLRAIHELAAPWWQPVLFLGDRHDDEFEVRALEAGADACVARTVAPEVLGARLAVLQRMLRLQHRAEGRAQELERYYRSEEDEKRAAGRLMQRFVRGAQLDDPAVRHWIGAANFLTGDIIAAQRTPSGALHVLLADGTGHGLTASINVLPVLAPFYRMSEKGYGIEAIARELNAKVKGLLPGERFIAATLAVIDMRERMIGVWNGGNPEPVLLGPHGARTFALRHVPLGVLPDEEFDDALDVHGFEDDSQFFAYSDGLIEAENAAGNVFGDERLARVLVNADAAGRFDALKLAVTAHVGGAAARDDISILMVECRRPGESPPAAAGRGIPPRPGGSAQWRSTLRLTAAEIRQVDAVPLLLSLAGQFEPVRRGSDRLFVVLSELYNNALDHGLLRLDSRLKLHPDGMEAYLGERQNRLAGLEHGEIELELEQFGVEGGGWLRVSCRDSGSGFDHAAFDLGATSDSEMPFGRGLMLLRAICADLSFNAEGNHVTATLALDSGGG